MDELVNLNLSPKYFNCSTDSDYIFDSYCRSLDPDSEDFEFTSGDVGSGGSGDYHMDNSPFLAPSPSASEYKHIFNRIKENDGTQSSCSSPQIRLQSQSENDLSAGPETASASEAEPSIYVKFDHSMMAPIVADEPHKKRYKSKDSEKNRRNRINDKLQELKKLIPAGGNKSLTKEEILIEAIHYIHNLHTQLNKKAGREPDHAVVPPPVVLNTGPQKRARLYMILFFVVGFGLFAFPFINPPQYHPLFYGDRIPRHHSRCWAGADNNCNASNQNFQVPLGPLLKEIIPYEDEETHHEKYREGEGNICEKNEDCDAWLTCYEGFCASEHLHGHKCSMDIQCTNHHQLINKPNHKEKEKEKEKSHKKLSRCFYVESNAQHSSNFLCKNFGRFCQVISASDYLKGLYGSDEEASSSSLY